MIKIIVNAFVEKDKTVAVVEVLYASSDREKVKALLSLSIRKRNKITSFI